MSGATILSLLRESRRRRRVVWTPKDLGALFTLDPDLIDTSRIISGAVDSANDAFSGPTVLQAPAASQRMTYDTVNTLNGHKAVSHVVASNTSLRTTTGGVTGVHDHSIVLVGQFLSTDGSFRSAAVMGGSGSGNSVIGALSGTQWWFGGNGLTSPSLVYDTAALHVVEKSYAANATEMKMWIDGAKEATNTTTSLNIASAAFGLNAWTSTNVSNYRCYYALWLDRVMGMVERRKLTSWLKSHFALSIIPAVIHDGDSLTAGGGAGNPVNSDYPYQMTSLITNAYRKYNSGVGGAKSADLLADVALQVDEYITPLRRENVYLLWIGHNDLTNGVSAETIWANIQKLVAGRRAAGCGKVALFTVFNGQDIVNTGANAQRLLLNSIIRANWHLIADALIDVDADARFGDYTNLTYFNSDKVHLNQTGYGVVAQLAAPVVNPWVVPLAA